MAMPAMHYAANQYTVSQELLANQAYLQLAIDNVASEKPKAPVDLPPFYQSRPSLPAAALAGVSRARLTARYEQNVKRKNGASLPQLKRVAAPRHSAPGQSIRPSVTLLQSDALSKSHARPHDNMPPAWLSELGVCALLLLPYFLIAKY